MLSKSLRLHHPQLLTYTTRIDPLKPRSTHTHTSQPDHMHTGIKMLYSFYVRSDGWVYVLVSIK